MKTIECNNSFLFLLFLFLLFPFFLCGQGWNERQYTDSVSNPPHLYWYDDFISFSLAQDEEEEGLFYFFQDEEDIPEKQIYPSNEMNMQCPDSSAATEEYLLAITFSPKVLILLLLIICFCYVVRVLAKNDFCGRNRNYKDRY